MTKRQLASRRSAISLERRLATYAIAGGAVFVAAEPADAAVIYSGVQNIFIGPDTSPLVDLDLNGDSVVDYQFQNHFIVDGFNGGFLGTFPKDERVLDLILGGSNQAVDNGFGSPAALPPGTTIDGSQSFNSTNPGTMAGVYVDEKKSGPNGTFGDWTGASNLFLGLRFNIGTDTHYGWARLSVSDGDDINTDPTATLHDWAYESAADTAIVTPVPEPSALMLLASGAAGLGAYRAWRRKRPEASKSAEAN